MEGDDRQDIPEAAMRERHYFGWPFVSASDAIDEMLLQTNHGLLKDRTADAVLADLLHVLSDMRFALGHLSFRVDNLEDFVFRATRGGQVPLSEGRAVTYTTDAERQEMEAAAAASRALNSRLAGLINPGRRPQPFDLSNVGEILLQYHRWLNGLTNQVRELRGEPPIPE